MSERLSAVFLLVLAGLIAMAIMVADPLPAAAQCCWGVPQGTPLTPITGTTISIEAVYGHLSPFVPDHWGTYIYIPPGCDRQISIDSITGWTTNLYGIPTLADAGYINITGTWTYADGDPYFLDGVTVADGYYFDIASSTQFTVTVSASLCPGEVPGGSTCANPQAVAFSLDEGINYSTGGLFSAEYGASQGWVGVLYEDDIAGPVAGDSYWPRFQSQDVANPYSHIGLYGISGLFGFGQGDYMAVEYLDQVVPENISTRVIYPSGADPLIELWVDDGGGWDLNDVITPTYDDIETFLWERPDHSIATVSFTPTIAITTPVNIALALGTTAAIPTILTIQVMGFDQIDIFGCFSGDPTTGDCVVSDPDLDTYDGEPSPYYWNGTYTPSAGQANLDAGEVIFQNVTPPEAATYQLDMIASGFYDGGPDCDFTIEAKDYDSTLILFSQDVSCKIGLVQNYSLPIDLPAESVEILLRQNTGALTLDYMCLSLSSEPDCLNPNPIFRQGIYGYSGDFAISGGQAVVDPSKSIAAFGVDYSEPITGGYQLEIYAAPVSENVDVRIRDDADPPTAATPGTIVSATTTITHIITNLYDIGTGPTVWNYNVFNGDLALTRYCITQILSGTIWYGGKTCDTLTNADFTNETTGWGVDNVTQVGGWVVFAPGGGSVSQTVTAISPATQTITATLHWIAASPTTGDVEGTALIVSDAGTYTITQSFAQDILGDEKFDQVSVAGDVEITISGPAGLQLDYACLLGGQYTEGSDTGSGVPLGANCAPPPRMVLSDTLHIWIWESDTPNNLEIITAYGVAWLRYIGCILTDLATMLEDMLNDILLWLKILTLLQGIDAVASTISAIADAIALLEETIDDLINTLTGPVASLAYILGIIAIFLATLLGLIALVIGLIALLWAIPSEFWTNFTGALNGDGVILLPFPDDESHPLIGIIYGIQVFNQTIGETILFPITIIAISIGSIYILWWTIRRFFRITF